MTGIEAIIERVRGSPLALANVARTLLLQAGGEDQARTLAAQALAMAPDDGEVRAVVAEVFSSEVPRYYFSMVRDDVRHAAYRRALNRALRSGGRVLEIGAGTGLFALMAARAGADEVIACERRRAVAQAASAVVERNGLQRRVKVVAKASTELEMGVDMDGPADVLIWDNLANDMIGAGALPAIEDARRRLLKPGAVVIPARVAVRAALAEDRALRRMSTVEGFDLTPFDALAAPAYTLSCDAAGLSMRSDATTAFAFDFRLDRSWGAEKAVRFVTGAGGSANGVVQWLDFQLDEHERYETCPGDRRWAFGLEFHPTPTAFEATAGRSFAIGAAHDRDRLRLWLEAG